MKFAKQASVALSSERAVCAVQSRRRDTRDGKGVVQYELIGMDTDSPKLVKRPTLLGSLLARVGALPVLPPPKPKRKPGPKPKPKAPIDLASSVKGGKP